MVLLFSQLAVAAYVCPAMNSAAAGEAAAMAGMPCAEMMAGGIDLDPEQPVLCLQHCQFGATTHAVDHLVPAFAPVTALPALFTVSLDEDLSLVLRAMAEQERERQLSPPLALSIAHCCFRI